MKMKSFFDTNKIGFCMHPKTAHRDFGKRLYRQSCFVLSVCVIKAKNWHCCAKHTTSE